MPGANSIDIVTLVGTMLLRSKLIILIPQLADKVRGRFLGGRVAYNGDDVQILSQKMCLGIGRLNIRDVVQQTIKQAEELHGMFKFDNMGVNKEDTHYCSVLHHCG